MNLTRTQLCITSCVTTFGGRRPGMVQTSPVTDGNQQEYSGGTRPKNQFGTASYTFKTEQSTLLHRECHSLVELGIVQYRRPCVWQAEVKSSAEVANASSAGALDRPHVPVRTMGVHGTCIGGGGLRYSLSRKKLITNRCKPRA